MTINALTVAARQQLLVEWNNTQAEFPDLCVHQLFEQQAAATPDALALIDGEARLTYAQLNQRANQVADHLQRCGVQPDDLVAICIERSLHLFVGLLGIFKAGGAYVPLDASYPAERLTYMLQDSAARILLTTQTMWQQLTLPAAATAQGQVLYVEEMNQQPSALPGSPLPSTSSGNAVTPHNLAYCIYTFGSTGNPKGALMEHRSLVNMLWWHKQTRPSVAGVKTLQFCAVSFDFSFHEIFGTLCLGGTLVLVDEETRRNPFALATFIQQQQIEKLYLPVTALLQLAEATQAGVVLSHLREVITTGELLQITPAIAHLFRQTGAMLHNHYGATEFQDATTYTLQGDPDTWPTVAPVGRPLANVQVYMLDEQQQPVSIGAEGEFCIGGVGVARGYLNRPDLTQAKFIANPFGSGRLYRTGDLARYRSDGVIEHLGRIDQQVKIRGFRVELGEIEAVLLKHPSVRECAVVAQEDPSGSKQLVSYLIATSPPDAHPTATTIDQELWRYLANLLPEHMLPTRFVHLATMPLTPSGKLDRRALPAPVWTRPLLGTSLVLPQTAIEQRLAQIWCDLLQIDHVGVQDSFFELGGTSLLLTRMHKTVREAFAADLLTLDLALVALFQYPTIQSLAHYLERLRQGAGDQQSTINRQPLTIDRQRTDIAIIGMAGRFPGAATIEQFWRNLAGGVESITFFDDDELEQLSPTLRQHPNYVRAGGILADIEQFDAGFFGYSPKEAAITDPQQRILLECAWEAFERAGYNPESYPGAVGVYAGSSLSTYLLNNVGPSLGIASEQPFIEADMAQFQAKIGSDRSYLATRISYKLNLKGPSVNVQTACSTSLVAVHLACQSLLTGECDMALAGGVSVVVPHKGGYLYEEGMVRSPDGHCRAFDAQAQGTLFSNGAGLVLLKRLPEALADGDQIIAVIKGSAINNDGSLKVGYTAPSVEGQATVIRQALAQAGVAADTIGYVETHGTATNLGDPIEVAALTQAFTQRTAEPLQPQQCAIGSVKTNIGHLDEAAGIAGLIKAALALQHGQIPASLHFTTPNPQINFANSPFYVNTTLRDWPRNGTPRHAGVSSFGVGGTNSHVVLEEPPVRQTIAHSPLPERTHHLLTLSAHTPEALHELAQRYIEQLETHPEIDVGDLCFTANTGRKHFAHRLAVVADSPLGLQRQFKTSQSAISAQKENATPTITFLFTGQGSQYIGMGQDLYETQPTFRAALDRCDEILQPLLKTSILSVLYPDKEAKEQGDTEIAREPVTLSDTAYTQPALFAIEYAIYQLWRSWGIQPDVVMGHSVGEYVAACVAGVFSLEDGLRLIAARGRLMQALPHNGKMLSVMASETTMASLLMPYPEQVSIAALNGPESTVLSGLDSAIDAIAEELTTQGIKCKELMVSHAFHSPLMEPMLADFARVAQEVTYAPPTINLISNLTGALADAAITHADHWVQHVRQPVNFMAGMESASALGVNIFVELGPSPVLLGMGQQCLDESSDKPNLWLPSLHAKRNDWQQILTSLGALYTRGVEIDWQALDAPYPRQRVPLPTYPFQRQRYWIEAVKPTDDRAVPQSGLAEWFSLKNIAQLTERVTNKGGFGANGREMVAKVLQILEAERQAEQLTSQIESMLYAISWEKQGKAPTMVPPTTPGHWLILAHDHQTDGDESAGAYLARELMALGERVDRVTNQTELATMLLHLQSRSEDAPPLRGLIHLWALDEQAVVSAANSDALDVDKLMAYQESNLGSLVQIVQACAKLKPAGDIEGPRIWVATQGAQQLTPSELVSFQQTPLWGVGRVIALEHGELWGGMVDFDAKSRPATIATQLLTHILQPRQAESEREIQIAYRNGDYFVARFVKGKVDKTESKQVMIHPEARYLVTGGLGGLGLVVAQWLVEQGANHLILIGRRGITTDQQQAAIAQLEQRGAKVEIAQVDVADSHAMHALFQQISDGPLPLKGIFHTAGILDDGILLNQSWKRFVSVLSAKVAGSWILHTLSQQMTLDMMIFFSSVTSLLGNPGQSNYAAANAFLDGLAQSRQQQGLPTLSINWGSWSEVGMAVRTSRLSDTSEDAWISPAMGMTALSLLLSHSHFGNGQLAVTPLDWNRSQSVNTLLRPFYKNLMAPSHQTSLPRSDKPSVLQELEVLSANQREGYLVQYLQQTVRTVLGMSAQVDRHKGFAELGMDSLMALELRRKLQHDLQKTLPTTIAFEYPTIHDLANYLLSNVLALAEARAQATDGAVYTIGMDEPIAVVSMACRFPDADTPEAFWQLLCQGEDKTQEIPPARWDVEQYYDPRRPLPGKMYTRSAAFIEHIDQFDPLFFGIAPREATSMDPQQRLLLEVSWELLENAGVAQRTLVDSQTGIFLGIGAEERYSGLNIGQNLADLDTHAVTNNGISIAAGRLAYTLGVQGPTLAVDTACSSSLVALHLACQSLRAGECDLALAGGVNLMLAPDMHVALSQMQALSVDGRCKTFDASADGYGRGEGVGMVLLKRLHEAQAAGDTIYAVIKGSAINHDGRSSGLTVPNKLAQEKVLRQALRNAQVTPQEVTYIEAHGTGTPLGDPIEIRALGAVFCAETAGAPGEAAVRKEPLLVGSVKTNIGHLEAAAGIAGFMKTVLALYHGQIPPHLHFNTPNPYIEWDAYALDVPTTLQAWPPSSNGSSRIAGVSAFGVSGTNAHVIVASAPPEMPLEENPSVGDTEKNSPKRPLHLLPLSAKSSQALQDLVIRYSHYLTKNADIDLGDLCHTAALGRNHFSHRLAIIATDYADLQTKLNAIVQQQALADGVQGIVPPTTPQIAFLFTGQGSQYIGMGAVLYETAPVFRAAVDRCDQILQSCLGRSLIDLLYPKTKPDHNDLMESHPCGQAANFAIECALADLWRSWGIEPAIVLGHSLGDFAAAYTAGLFSLEDGLRLVVVRGQLMERARGSMVSVLASEEQIRPFISSFDDVTIGVINGPQSVVISGGYASMETVTRQLNDAGFKTKLLDIPVAAHSPMLDPVLDTFEEAVRQITLASPKIPVVSSMTGQLVADELTDPTYWRHHLRNTVRFGDGVSTLHKQGINIFLEIGPGATLLGMAEQIYDKVTGGQELALSLSKGDKVNDSHPVTARLSSPNALSPLHPVVLPSLRKSQPDWQQMLTSLGELYVHGVEIDWQGFAVPYARQQGTQRVLLPTYPFQRERYWVEMTAKRDAAMLSSLTDKLTKSPRLKEIVSETAMSVARLPFLSDHRVFGEVVSPGACQLAMTLDAAQLAYPEQKVQIVDVALPHALVLAEGEERTVQVIFSATGEADPPTNGQFQAAQESLFELISFNVKESNRTWQTHASGHLVLNPLDAVPAVELADLRSRCATAVDINAFYANSATQQIQLGQAFRWLAEVWSGEKEIIGRLVLPEGIESMASYSLHPALLDACFQLTAAYTLADQAADVDSETRLPFAVDSLTLLGNIRGDEWWGHAGQVDDNKWHIQLFDSAGNVLVQIEGFTERTAPRHLVLGIEPWHEWLYALRWMEQEPRSDLAPSRSQIDSGQNWLLFADQAGLGDALATQLQAQGDSAILVYAGTAFEPRHQDVQTDNGQIAPIYHIRIDQAADYQNLLSTLTQTAVIDRVLFLWGLDAVDLPTGADIDSFEEHIRALTVSALHLLHALLQHGLAPQLWFVTQDTQAALPDDKANHFGQALLWGMGRTVALEYPELCSQLIDLDGNVPLLAQVAPLATRLREEWVDLAQRRAQRHPPHKAQIAWRDNRWYRAALAHQKPKAHRDSDSDSAMPIRPDATYLLTGGLGGLGLEVARWLVEQGATHLMLVGRSRPTTAVQTQIAELEAMGASVVVIQADVSRRDSLSQVLGQIPTAYPLRGIIHAAGVIDDAALLQQRWAHFAKAYAPKVFGAWHLHTLTQEQPLDFLVFFSSVAGLFGSGGQTNHAAANALLDSFAHHLRANGAPALTINWGAWAKVGLAADMAAHVKQQMAARGEGFIDPAQGVKSLGYLLQQDLAHAAIVPIDWQAVLRTDQKDHALFAALAAQFTAKSRSISTAQADPAALIREQLTEASPAERRQVLLEHVQQQVAQVLQSKALLPTHRPFTELGMDSLMSVELRRRLATTLQLQLSATIAFDYPTSNRLATFLLEQWSARFDADVSEQEPVLEDRKEMEEITHASLRIQDDGAELDTASLEELLALEALLQEMGGGNSL